MPETEADAAFHLRADHVGIDGHAAIDGAPHLMNLGSVTVPGRYFRALGDEAVETFDHRDAARTITEWPRPGPARKLRDRPQDASRPWRLAHQRQTAGDRVLAYCLQQLVDETFHRVARVRVPDRAPP